MGGITTIINKVKYIGISLINYSYTINPYT